MASIIRMRLLITLTAMAMAFSAAAPPAPAADDPAALHVLMLGDSGPHKPAERIRELVPYLLHRGVKVHYTERVDDLNAENLARYDALMIYANITTITPEQEAALLGYIEGGGGLVAVHCASYCFHNSPKYIAMVGGQFSRHGTGVFATRIVKPDHPVVRGYKGFESWDETYEHAKQTNDRTILSVRDGEPYTWIKSHGKGRVFYTAWGHDARTWTNPGFHDLIERGVRWAAGDDQPAKSIAARAVLPPVETVQTDQVPFYPPGGDRSGTGKWPRMPKPLSAEASMQHMITPAGFRVELFAAEPDIRKPVCMTWDARGRLWVAETLDYPNEIRPEGQGRDRITICEDIDGDGRADKFTVFADKLNMPTSMAFARGGLVVLQAPDTLFFKDTDGDDVADVRQVLFSGWSKGDTHAGPSNLLYGLDNHLWGIIGYAGFNGEVGGEQHRFGQAFWRMTPNASKLEVVRHTNNNSWGVGFTEDGLLLGSTANAVPSVYAPIPMRYYANVQGLKATVLQRICPTARFLPITDRVRQVDVHWGYTSAAGHAVYTARAWPREYWNSRAFVAGPTGHLLGVFDLTRRGADVASVNHENMLSSDDEWCAPIMAEVGPDGQLWVIDWYNYIVQHNPTPKGWKTGPGNAYINELRDKRHGRVYRIVWPDAKRPAAKDLTNAAPRELVATLADDNLFWRRHAQRLLVERGETDVAEALIALVTDTEVDAVGLNVGAIHALWTLHGLGLLDGSHAAALEAAEAALRHPSPGVRRNALLALPPTEQTNSAILAAGSLTDNGGQVRLAALLALSQTPPSKIAGATVFGTLAEPRNHEDRWIAEAAAMAGVRHSEGFLAAASSVAGETQAPKPTAGPNLLPNPSFEQVAGGRPAGWTVRAYSGKADLTVDNVARTGDHALRITSATGSDSSYFAKVKLKPNTRYRLSAWIRTSGVQVTGHAHGALLNVHELPAIPGNRTPALKGDNDWRRVESEFATGNDTDLSINCLFGGWGLARGTAWFDDVELIELGPDTGGGVSRIVALVKANAGDAASSDVAGANDRPLDVGGDVERGKKIFWTNEVVGCFRCHKIGEEGGIVGPDLTGIASRQKAAYLVESLVDPNAAIAETYTGTISPMPPIKLLLSDQEVRDVIAYLKSLK